MKKAKNTRIKQKSKNKNRNQDKNVSCSENTGTELWDLLMEKELKKSQDSEQDQSEFSKCMNDSEYDDDEQHCPFCGGVLWGMPSADNTHCYICGHCYQHYDLLMNHIDREEYKKIRNLYSTDMNNGDEDDEE